METMLLETSIAFACAFLFAYVVVRGLYGRIWQKIHGNSSGLRSQGGWLGWRLRNGIRPLLPLSGQLLKIRFVNRTVENCVTLVVDRGYDTSARSLLSVLLCSLVLAALVIGIAARSVAVGVLAIVALLIILTMAVSAGREKTRTEAYEALPDVLSSMSACFNAGFTLLQTFSQVARDVKGPMAVPFAQAAHILETGGSAEDALGLIKNGSLSRELSFVAVALDVQHQSGGSMKQVFAAASDAVRGDLSLRRTLRVQTAQAKLSARIVSAMPLVLIVVFSIVSPGFLDPFFSSTLGIAMLILAIVMQLSGILLVRRALSVGGVS